MYYIDWYAVDDLYEPRIGGQQFRRLLEVCFQESDCFSLSVGLWSNQVDTLQRMLAHHTIKEKVTRSWFGYYPLPMDDKATQTTRILYPTNDTTRGILETYCDNLWLQSDAPGYTQSLEDICFFLKGKLILGTVSHEHICQAYPTNEKFMTELRDVYPHWKKNDDSSECMDLRDYELWPPVI